MSSSCNRIQEEISWGNPLNEADQAHVLACPKCGKVAMDFATLDAAVGPKFDVEVPDDFAERVMARINEERETTPLSIRIQDWLGLRPVQISLAYVGAMVALMNIIYFVMGVIFPTVA